MSYKKLKSNKDMLKLISVIFLANAVQALDAAEKSDPYDTTEKFDPLFQWMKEEGAEFPDIELR